tara:strand:- start:130 stop:396 length:267 start_codon:yes stop_codon:yes gene_type:complete
MHDLNDTHPAPKNGCFLALVSTSLIVMSGRVVLLLTFSSGEATKPATKAEPAWSPSMDMFSAFGPSSEVKADLTASFGAGSEEEPIFP